jgi:hypothetical protein
VKRQKSEQNKKDRPISPEAAAAKARMEAYSIEQQTLFERKYGHLDNSALDRASFEAEMLGMKLRHMLWCRRLQNNQGN